MIETIMVDRRRIVNFEYIRSN